MNNKQIAWFRDGYAECRHVIVRQLRQLLEQSENHEEALTYFVETLEDDMEADHWRSIQEEFPGITREEYEEELGADAKACKACMEILEKYYGRAGLPKVRLVKS